MHNRLTRLVQSPLSCMLLLFAVNAVVCTHLWTAEYVDQMGSIEGSFIAISRFVMRHWGDLQWFPDWYSGMPLVRVYQPGLHVTVAAVASICRFTPQHAYHLVTALAYSLGPVSLFWMCDRLTGRRGFALAASLVYSLFSPSVLFSSDVLNDVGRWFFARRYQAMAHYGEGPHIAALALLPLVIWSLDGALMKRRSLFIALSAGLLGALVVTNWTGTVGLIMALAAYFISRIGAMRWPQWFSAAGIGILAYLLAGPWIPPSVIVDVPANAQNSDGTFFSALQLEGFGALALVLAILHLVFERKHTDRNFRFFAYFLLCSAGVVLSASWGRIALVPQPHRFQLEMEMALIGTVLFPLALQWKRVPAAWRAGFTVVFTLLCGYQLRHFYKYAESRSQPIRIENTSEYREAKWMEAHLPGERVLVPGSVSFWMNAFTDMWQVLGCCDQSVPSDSERIAQFQIYSGMGAGDRDAEISTLWLRAYGAGAVAVSGPHSAETFKPFAAPRKFNGYLPEIWRDGDDAIYRIPRLSASLAHVILPEQAVVRKPANGIDIEPLKEFVRALDDPALPQARMQWLNAHTIRISTTMSPEQYLSVQVTYSRGWRASENGNPVPLHADGIGLIVVEPHCNGACMVNLVYDGGPEARWLRMGQALGIILCIVWPVAHARRVRKYANPPE
jgi:hypothetical protein